MSARPRVLVASVFHEAHSFNPLLTRLENFVILRGQAMLDKAATSSSGLGGGVRQLLSDGAELLPVLSAVAAPGGPVEDAVWVAFRDEIVAAASRLAPDAVFLDLHGAIAAEATPDAEGDILSRVRAATGPDVPIAVPFDLHGHMTPQMLGAANILIGCKENPHSDYHLAGARAAQLLLQQLRGQIRPVTATVWIPAQLYHRLETAQGPLAALHAYRREILAGRPSLLDISLFNTHSMLDLAPAGQCVLALADGDADTAIEAAQLLAQAIWDKREAFTAERPTLEVVLDELAQAPPSMRPFVLGDWGDRVLGAGPGDGTFILRELLRRGNTFKAAIPITDPDAVAAARDIGIGGRGTFPIGARWSRLEIPVALEWTVRHLGDGHFVQRGPFLANEPAALGNTAVLEHGPLTIMATTFPGLSQDPEAFLSNGIDPAAHDIVVAKSGYHYRLNFAGIGTSRPVQTPGMTTPTPGQFPFVNRPPLWPEAQVTPDLVARVFDASGRAGIGPSG